MQENQNKYLEIFNSQDTPTAKITYIQKLKEFKHDLEETELIRKSFFEIMQKRGETATRLQLNELIQDKIQEILPLNKITCEVIGSWVWIDNKDKNNVSALMQAGFKFSHDRKRWFWTANPPANLPKDYQKKEYEEIKQRYPSEVIAKISK
jgi:hypothetical protein